MILLGLRRTEAVHSKPRASGDDPLQSLLDAEKAE